MYGVQPYISLMPKRYSSPRDTSSRAADSGGAAYRELKSERLELRVSPTVRALIERATALSGLAAGDLAYEGARRVLEDHERMQLHGRDRDLFFDALAHPPSPSPRLVAAFRKHRKLGA